MNTYININLIIILFITKYEKHYSKIILKYFLTLSFLCRQKIKTNRNRNFARKINKLIQIIPNKLTKQIFYY